MKTLCIELRWPFPARVIDADVSVTAANALLLDPPPLLVAACATRARAEAARRGWQSRRAAQALRLTFEETLAAFKPATEKEAAR